MLVDTVESSLETSNCSNSECSCQTFEGETITKDSGHGHSCTGSFCFDSGCVREGGGGGEWGKCARTNGETVVEKRRKKSETRVKQGTVRSPAASSPVCLHY